MRRRKVKIRKGFVSNSSSSSFVVLIPKSFDINNVDWNSCHKEMEIYSESTIKGIKAAFTSLLENKTVTNYEYGDNEVVLECVLKDYILADFESGSEDGKIVLAEEEKIRRILNEN
jgi:hypothetical protein